MVAARPIRALDASETRQLKTLAVFPRKLTLYRAHAHPAAKAVGSEVLVPSAGPKTHNMGAIGLEVHILVPRRFGESHPIRPV